jgi:hypothetical protein
MEKKDKQTSKKVTDEVKTTLSAVAAKLKGKELFPDKIENARLFFSHLKPAKH